MKIFLDTGDWRQFYQHPAVAGYTTNPTLIKKTGITSAEFFGDAVRASQGKPISLEVFADDMAGMEEQAMRLAALGQNVYIKIPITNTQRDSTHLLIKKLSREGLKINVTAIMTHDQTRLAARSLYPHTPSIISIFCGRIADTGRDPVPFITTALHCKAAATEVLWASTREVYNIHQARQASADIITVSPEIMNKYLEWEGKDLEQLSLETVRQFHNDSKGMTF